MTSKYKKAILTECGFVPIKVRSNTNAALQSCEGPNSIAKLSEQTFRRDQISRLRLKTLKVY